MSVIAPIHALSVLSINLSDNEHHKILEEFPGINYGKKFPVETMVKIPDDAMPILCKAKL